MVLEEEYEREEMVNEENEVSEENKEEKDQKITQVDEDTGEEEETATYNEKSRRRLREEAEEGRSRLTRHQRAVRRGFADEVEDFSSQQSFLQ